MYIQQLGIDTRWRQTADVVKRYIRECGYRNVIPYRGKTFPATQRQLEEHELRKGWFFEHQKHPEVKEPMWVIRPNAGDGMFYMSVDTDRAKDFLFSRLASPPGTSRTNNLLQGTQDDHELFSHHLCNSEYPELISARGIEKNSWIQRENQLGRNNDWLDTSVGCIALASMQGARLMTGGESLEKPKRNTERWKKRLASRRT